MRSTTHLFFYMTKSAIPTDAHQYIIALHGLLGFFLLILNEFDFGVYNQSYSERDFFCLKLLKVTSATEE